MGKRSLGGEAEPHRITTCSAASSSAANPSMGGKLGRRCGLRIGRKAMGGRAALQLGRIGGAGAALGLARKKGGGGKVSID